MTEYGRERERRRRQRSLLWLGYLVVMGVVLALRVGPWVALAGVGAIAMVIYAVLTLFVWRDRRAELRRRAAGEPPSWSAQLPVVVARQFGGVTPGRHGREEVGELFGRLRYLGDRLRWEPSEALRAKGTEPVTWDRSWRPTVVPLWGPGSQGCLTLTNADGAEVDVWVRNPRDLSRTLGLG
ncbi:hypothetical protein [Kutzneria kofuensis]|uniref:Uncharacterized protein n=1 Tax=Kutzneria kofuensis TaxID=103725 RepID=A0A7W9NGC1_9PSEU|nr:hypothetical protein [Kutzneria kofuensis]MBB5892372.1 hypothetical protein [Kutzneria kofuensis]